MDAARSKGQTGKVLEMNRPFHEIMHKAAKSPLLYDYINDLYASTSRFRELAAAAPGRLDAIVEEHRELVEAVIAGDGERAERIARLHHENNAGAVIEVASQLEESE
jgi:DNA-binding GntR family transcriptional regulator